MFGEITLASFETEAILGSYLLRGELQSRGDLFAFLNDRNWNFVPIHEGEVCPLSENRKFGAMKRSLTMVNKNHLESLSVLKEEDAKQVRLSIYQRPVLFILDRFVVQGDLRVSEDAPDVDVLDELHDFFPVTDVSIFPIQSVATTPTERVPLLFISRPAVQLYRIQEAE